MAVSAQRYTAFAIVLHWAIAFAIAFMIPLGWWMHEAVEHSDTVIAATAAYQLHKSIGLTVLALSLIRLGWRLLNPPPPLPAHMPAWEKMAAKATHWAFYALIIAMPLTGWLYVSTAWSAHENHALAVTTRWFKLFTVPPLFDLPHAPVDTRRGLAGVSIFAHGKLAWGIIILAVLHVAAALKHQFADRDEVLAHMVPGLKPPNETAPPPKNAVRRMALGAGFAAIAVAAVAAGYAVTHLAPAGPAPDASIVVEEHQPGEGEAEHEHGDDHIVATTATATTAAAPRSAPGAVAHWAVNQAASSIRFHAVYTDEEGSVPFAGAFGRWRADIRFDPGNLAQSSAVVTIETATAADHIVEHDRRLPTEPWFNSSAQPNAEFRTTEMRHLSGDRYEARGRLTIKGHSVSVRLPFTLAITGDHAVMDGQASLVRTAFDIGVRDEDGNDRVSRDVTVNVHLEATRGQ